MDASAWLPMFLPLLAQVGEAADRIGAWLVTYALHSTALVLAAWALAMSMRGRWSASAEAAVWRTALVAGWVTATLQLAVPWRPLAGVLRLPASAPGMVTAVHVESVERRLPSSAGRSAGPRPMAVPPAAGARAGNAMPGSMDAVAAKRVIVVAVSFVSIAVAGWAVVAALSAAHLEWRRRRLRAVLAGRHDARESLAGNALRHLMRSAGVTRPVALSFSDALAVPAALPGDEIVLPLRAVRDLTLAEQEAVLAHELAHVVRRDPWWLQLAGWVERVAWFQPLNRVAVRRMHMAAECAADAWAARLTGEPLRLAQALARVASWRRARGAGSAFTVAMGADGSPLVDRVRRLTAPGGIPTPTVGGGIACGAMGALAVVALLALPAIERQAVGPPFHATGQQVQLRLTDAVGGTSIMTWRTPAGAAARQKGAGPPGLRAQPPLATAVIGGGARRAAPAPPAPATGARRTFLIVRRGAGTAS